MYILWDNEKVDIENMISEKMKNFSINTIAHTYRLFEMCSYNKVFVRSMVMEILKLKSSGASKFISNLLHADIIEPVSGYGKGKYKFKK